jgi:hypothetical protein
MKKLVFKIKFIIHNSRKIIYRKKKQWVDYEGEKQI